MKPLSDAWQFWALLSAAFAALTAIFAKIGVEQVTVPDALQLAAGFGARRYRG